MRTFGEDEASITGTISVLKLISEELGLSIGGEEVDGEDLQDRVVMYYGDYLTVRNIRYVKNQDRSWVTNMLPTTEPRCIAEGLSWTQ